MSYAWATSFELHFNPACTECCTALSFRKWQLLRTADPFGANPERCTHFALTHNKTLEDLAHAAWPNEPRPRIQPLSGWDAGDGFIAQGNVAPMQLREAVELKL